MDTPTVEAPMIEAWIARGRVKEMLAKGWRAVGPIREDVVLMSGPDPDDEPAATPMALGDWLSAALPATLRLRQMHGMALEQILAEQSGAGRERSHHRVA